MATVHDIAAYILERRGPLTAMKLQKLVYYSQAWSLARRSVPLFPEQLEAWAHGPVAPDLFRIHRGQFIVGKAWPAGDSSALSSDERIFVDSILECYGHLSAATLSARTHAEGPWKCAREGVGTGQRASTIISLESMRQFYCHERLEPQ